LKCPPFPTQSEEAPVDRRDDGEHGELGDDKQPPLPPPKASWNFKEHVSTYTQPSSEQYEKFCSQADGFRSVTEIYDMFFSRVSCCRFYPAYFCPAKRRDMVHLNWFEQV
jgi:hypothetical protein